MSQTFELVCYDCKTTIWIGQSSNSRGGMYLYADGPHVKALEQYLLAHTEHKLEFMDTDGVNPDYTEVENKT